MVTDHPQEQLRRVRELVLAGLCLALGLTLPWLVHVAGAGSLGRVLLPMYLPVLLAGLLLRPPLAVLVGALTPVLSSALTGMPPPLPTLPLTVAELVVLAGAASLLHRRLRLNVWIAAPGALVLGRLTLALLAAGLGGWLGLPVPGAVYVGGALLAGLPGVALLLAIVPPLALIAERRSLVTREERA